MASPATPDFRILINDQEVPEALRGSVTSVQYADGIDAADRVEIALANQDLRWLQDHIRGLGFQPFPTGITLNGVRVGVGNDGLFDVDNKLTLELGYAPDHLEEVFLGDITGVQAEFPAGQMPSLTLVAHDRMHRLTKGSYARGFGPLPDVLIAAILSAENLLIPMIDPVVAAGSVALAAVNYVFAGTSRKQKGQSDLELMREIAATYDADFWVEGDVFYLARFFPKEYEPRLTLTWGESLIDFSPQVSTVGEISGAAMKFALREIPLSFLVNVFFDFDREAVGIRVVPGEAASATKILLGPMKTAIDQPIGSPADIANSALVLARELRNSINNRLTGSGTAVGDSRIRAGAVVKLEGMGPDFSGNYRVSSATHTVDAGGYRTRFEVRKELIP